LFTFFELKKSNPQWKGLYVKCPISCKFVTACPPVSYQA